MTISFLLLCLCGLISSLHGAKNEGREAELLYVYDGDTISVMLDDVKERVRLVGIDAPETKQQGGSESGDHLKMLLKKYGGTLKVEVDERDMYGRLLGTLFAGRGEVDVNRKMVKDGHAWCYLFKKCPKSYLRAMEKARSSKKGLWEVSNPTPPWEWRKTKKQRQLAEKCRKINY